MHYERQIYSKLTRDAADGLKLLLSKEGYIQLSERKEPFSDRWTIEVVLPVADQQSSDAPAAAAG